jgi:type IV pilus assembly protein PilE
MRPRKAGFSLIELLIVVVVVSILIVIGVPGYRQYVQRANRSDATAALLRIAAAQERFYLQANRYAANAAELSAPPPNGLGIAGSERGFYDLSIVSVDPATRYTATATPAAGGDQDDDTECWRFTMDERGVRGAFDQGGTPNDEFCWR